MARYKMEALWDCEFCNTKEIPGSKQDCPNCGKTRGKRVSFYLPQNIAIEHAVKDTSGLSDEADWYCEFCDSLNKASKKKCANCGAEKIESKMNYFSFRKEK